MTRKLVVAALLSSAVVLSSTCAWAGQAPAVASAPDIPVSHHDRVYAAEQFSNTVSVTDPADNKLLGGWSGAASEGGKGWPSASRIAAISCCWVTMISCAIRRRLLVAPMPQLRLGHVNRPGGAGSS
jgi:hypothetical protein